MSEIKIPEPLIKGQVCENCQFWLAGEAKNYVLQNNQLVELSQLIKNGTAIPDIFPQGRFAPCTLHPTWQPVVKHHWCGQYRPKLFVSEIWDDGFPSPAPQASGYGSNLKP